MLHTISFFVAYDGMEWLRELVKIRQLVSKARLTPGVGHLFIDGHPVGE